MKRVVSVVLLSAIMVLTGCVAPAMQGKSAAQVGLRALEKNMDETAYNFQGQVRFNLEPQASGQGINKLSSTDQAVLILSKNMHFDFSGALDMNRQYLEMTPTIAYEQQNLQGSIALPIVIQGKSADLFVDLSSLSLIFPRLNQPDVKGKFIRLPRVWSQLMGLGSVFNPATMADAKKIYSRIDPKAYSFQPLTELEKKRGAVQKVRVGMTGETLGTFLCSLVGMSGANQSEDAANNTDRQNQCDIARLFSDKDSAEAVNMAIDMDLGINRQGQIVSYIFEAKASGDILKKELFQSVGINLDMALSHFDRPVLKYNLSETDIAELSEADVMGLFRFLGDDEVSAEADAAATQEARPALKNPLPKHKGSKKSKTAKRKR